MDIPKTVAKRKPKKCANCNSRNIASILYGMPAYDEKMEKDIADKKIVLGGCEIHEDAAKWICTDCETEYYKENPAIDGMPIS